MPTLFIANPAANHGQNSALLTSLRERALRAQDATWVETKYEKHATELAARARADGFDTVAAVGGDGTVHETVNGLMQIGASERPSLGVIPIGTGNDFAMGSGLFTTDSNVALQRVLNRATTRAIDCARVTDGIQKTEYWDNTLGIGFDAAANLQAKSIKVVTGFAMYLLAVVRTIAQDFQASRMHLRVDGEELARDILMLTVGNGPREGGGFTCTPASILDDGLLNFCMVEQLSRAQMIALLPRVMNGTHVSDKHVTVGTFKKLHVQMDRHLPIHVDGEIFAFDARNELEIEVIPAGLRVIV